MDWLKTSICTHLVELRVRIGKLSKYHISKSTLSVVCHSDSTDFTLDIDPLMLLCIFPC